MNTFGDRVPVCFTKGKGIKLEDTEGRIFSDFFAGIAVSVLGYAHPKLIDTICNQAARLLHCSNYYYVESQAILAEKLAKATCADRFFFCNSGAEANETAIKLARIHYKKSGYSDKYNIIAMQNSFHGRTITTLSATGQEKYSLPFEPLTPGFIHVPMNNYDALQNAVGNGNRICAILLEPIQGESGVNAAETPYIKKVKELCEAKDILLIFDEVQCGLGRTGKFMAYEHFQVEPDIYTLAKGLGGGVPIGAVGAKEHVALSFSPGEHGSTFGGNPLACATAVTVVEEMLSKGFIEKTAENGRYFIGRLKKLAEKYNIIREVRGKGLMIGIEYVQPIANRVKNSMFDLGYLVGAAGDKVTRLLPPLIICKEDIDEFIIVYERLMCDLINNA